MNHAITVGDLAHAVGALVGVVLVIVSAWLLGSVIEAKIKKFENDTSLVSGCGCFLGLLGIAIVALMLSACGDNHPAVPSDRIVEVDRPVAIQPIKPSDVPPLPGQLPPRPADARAAADLALAGRCDAIAFVIRAWPLLQIAAGRAPAPAPAYPECDKK